MIAGPPAEPTISRPLQHLFSSFEILVQLVIEFGDQATSEKDEDSASVQDQHGGKSSCIPKREPYAHATRIPPQSHDSSSRRMNPTPRTVWINFVGNSKSTFFRRRLMWTSITLSSGVARESSFHTSRVS